MSNQRSLFSVCAAIAMTAIGLLQAGDADARGRVQRMVFTPQSHTIAPKSRATAEAFCLDLAGDTPPVGSTFRSVPRDMSRMFVEVGSRKMSVQDAINQSLLAITGTGDSDSLGLQNLTNREIRFVVEKPSPILPDATYASRDLKTALDAMGDSKLDQMKVWDVRARDQARVLGLPTDQIQFGSAEIAMQGNTFTLNVAQMEQFQQSVARAPKDAAAYVVHRVEADEPSGKPLYFLYTGNEPPRRFLGNPSLGELGEQAAKSWRAAGRQGGPRLVFAGEGGSRDFDAAAFTITVKTKSASKDDTIRFDTPKEFRELDPVAARWSSSKATFTRERNGWRGEQTIGTTKISVWARTMEIVAELLSIVREMITNPAFLASQFKTEAQKTVLKERIKRRAEERFREVKEMYPEVDTEGGVDLKVDLGGESISIHVAGVPNGRTQVARLAQ